MLKQNNYLSLWSKHGLDEVKSVDDNYIKLDKIWVLVWREYKSSQGDK